MFCDPRGKDVGDEGTPILGHRGHNRKDVDIYGLRPTATPPSKQFVDRKRMMRSCRADPGHTPMTGDAPEKDEGESTTRISGVSMGCRKPVGIYGLPDRPGSLASISMKASDWRSYTARDCFGSAPYVEALSKDRGIAHDQTVLSNGVILPENEAKKRWDLFVLIVILYFAISIPFRLGFNTPPAGKWFIIENMLLCSFIVDIIITFNTAVYLPDDRILVRRQDIARHYLSYWFWIDLLGSVRACSCMQPHEPRATACTRMFTGICCVQLLRRRVPSADPPSRAGVSLHRPNIGQVTRVRSPKPS